MPPVVLDLQATFTRAFDSGRYPDSVDYTSPPPVPLREEDAEWADQLLKEHGFRS